MKVRETGHFVVYVPTSTVYHFEGQSAGTGAATGMKSSQEFNRSKFRKKWDMFSVRTGEKVNPWSVKRTATSRSACFHRAPVSVRPISMPEAMPAFQEVRAAVDGRESDVPAEKSRLDGPSHDRAAKDGRGMSLRALCVEFSRICFARMRTNTISSWSPATK